MAVKRSGQLSLADALVVRGTGGQGRLERVDGLVKWYRFEKLLKGLRDENGPGRPSYPALVMFKALLLQSLYGLSDAELEEVSAQVLLAAMAFNLRRWVALAT